MACATRRGKGGGNISINCEQLKRAYEYIIPPGVIYARFSVCVCVSATETWRKFASGGVVGGRQAEPVEQDSWQG